MMTYEEMTKNALERIEQHKAEQKKRRKTAAKIAIPAVCCCLAAAVGIGVWKSDFFRKTPTLAEPRIPGSIAETAETENVTENETVQAVFTEEAEGTTVPAVTFENEDPTGSVEKPSEDGNGIVTAVTAVSEGSENTTAVPSAPEVQTETEIVTASDGGQKGGDVSAQSFCLLYWNGLSVTGELKNAIDNNPGGVFSVLASYHPATAEITSFVYEGKTLSEWAIAAFEEDAPDEAKKGYSCAYYAYLEKYLTEEADRLTANGIRCEHKPWQSNSLTLIATAEQLKNLPLDKDGSWSFDLASDDLKGAAAVTDPNGLNVVN